MTITAITIETEDYILQVVNGSLLIFEEGEVDAKPAIDLDIEDVKKLLLMEEDYLRDK